MKMEKTIQHTAHRETYRKQQIKTGISRLLWIPIATLMLISLVLLATTFLVNIIGIKNLNKWVKNSEFKKALQKENYKPLKKEYKMEKKDLKKSLKYEKQAQIERDKGYNKDIVYRA